VIPELKELGAGVVLLDTPDLRDRVAAVTQSSPVKLAIDAVGGAATARLASCLDENGTVISYSSMSGEPCHMPSDLLGARGIRLCGIHPARQLAKHKPEERGALYKKFGELLAAGRLRGRLGATYTLETAVEAIRHVLRDGDKRIGRVVIRVQELPVPSEIPVPAAEPVAGVAMPALAAAPANATASGAAPAGAAPAAAGGAPPATQAPGGAAAPKAGAA
jgi:hypothetical protein